MKTFISVAALVALIPSAMAALTINTPPAGSVVACEPLLLSWVEGVPPYYLTLVPGGQPSVILQSLASATNDMKYTWKVDLPVGTAFTAAIKDSTGATAYTDTLTVLKSPSDATCSASSGGAAPTGGAATTGSAATIDGAAGSGSSAGAAGSSSHTSGGSAAPSSTSQPSSAMKLSSFGAFTAVMGLVGAALF